MKHPRTHRVAISLSHAPSRGVSRHNYDQDHWLGRPKAYLRIHCLWGTGNRGGSLNHSNLLAIGTEPDSSDSVYVFS